jgi:hypothetical protein
MAPEGFGNHREHYFFHISHFLIRGSSLNNNCLLTGDLLAAGNPTFLRFASPPFLPPASFSAF